MRCGDNLMKSNPAFTAAYQPSHGKLRTALVEGQEDVHNTGRFVDFKTTIHQPAKLLGHARLKWILDFDAVVQLAVVEVFGIDSDAACPLGGRDDQRIPI